MNSGQILRRLPVWLSRSQPDVLLVWAGVNNAWNVADMDYADTSVLDEWLLKSRLYKYVRVWLHDRELDRYEAQVDTDAWSLDSPTVEVDGKRSWNVTHDGVRERITHRVDRAQDREQVASSAISSLVEIARVARAAGSEPYFVLYPISWDAFIPANEAIRLAAERANVPVIDTRLALARVPVADRDLLPGMHPNPPIYRAIARDVADALVGPSPR